MCCKDILVNLQEVPGAGFQKEAAQCGLEITNTNARIRLLPAGWLRLLQSSNTGKLKLLIHGKRSRATQTRSNEANAALRLEIQEDKLQ